VGLELVEFGEERLGTALRGIARGEEPGSLVAEVV
jgi:hypothetical protein